MSRWRARLAALVLAGSVLAPGLASACAVCMASQDDDSRVAFIATTAFLTFLPLLVGGGAFWWLRRRLRALEQEGSEAPGAVSDAPIEPSARAR